MTFALQNGLTFVDIFLAVLNMFNLFVIFSHVHPVASPLKKGAVTLVHNAIGPIHQSSVLPSLVLFSCLCIAGVAGYLEYSGDDRDMAMIVRGVVAFYTFTSTATLMKISETQRKLGMERYLDTEREIERKDIVAFTPPPLAVVDALLMPMKHFLRIDVVGLDRIPPNQPHFYIMNHSLYGIEMPFFLHTLYKQRGIFVRGLADHFHFATPNGPILRQMGAVDGTRANVDALMESHQDVLVYPGGGHEVLKHSSVPRYQLMWKQRLGFARMAIKHKYPILPCAAVGTEDMLSTIMDIPAGFLRKGITLPVAVVSPGKVQKIYFWFGEPISTEKYGGNYTNDDFAREVRDVTKASIEAGIKELLDRQENDPERYAMDQFTRWLKGCFDGVLQKIFCQTEAAANITSSALNGTNNNMSKKEN